MKVIVHGVGSEGRAAAAFFRQQADVHLVTFDDAGARIDGVASLSINEADKALSNHVYLRSPGVPPTHPLVVEAARRSPLATTPTGYWLGRFAPQGAITVTGTKGKSTTTALLAAILAKAGRSSSAYGNIGRPVLKAPLPHDQEPVVEVSSYMMHDLPPTDHLHLVTSLYKEHTDWHGSEAAYRAAKLKPFRRDPPSQGWAPRALIEQEGLPPSVRAIEDRVQIEARHALVGGLKASLGPLEKGFHDGPLSQSLAAAMAAASDRLPLPSLISAVEAVVERWEGLPSRQERVPTTDGVEWIDDALATIPEATLSALSAFGDRTVYLIMGGADRGQDFTALAAYLKAHPTVIALSAGPVATRLSSVSTLKDSFEAAVREVKSRAVRGDVILFSPAAPSSPPHADYQQRSALFKRLAQDST